MSMNLMDVAANISALLGILVCALAGGARVAGVYYVLGYEAMTLFIGGMGLMIFAALLMLRRLKSQCARQG